jgi:hypothetical protein
MFPDNVNIHRDAFPAQEDAGRTDGNNNGGKSYIAGKERE